MLLDIGPKANSTPVGQPFDNEWMATTKPRIAVVDDDASVLKALARLLTARSLAAKTYLSAHEFLASLPDALPDCLIVDLQMPKMTGLQVQEELARLGREIPIIFLTGHGAVSAGVQAMKLGAVDFLEKPSDERRLCEAVERALGQSLQTQHQSAAQLEARRRLDRLTPREHQVCGYVMAGLLNKQSADRIGIAESTVKVHRSRMMKKLGVASVVELIRLVDTARGPWSGNGSGNGYDFSQLDRPGDEDPV